MADISNNGVRLDMPGNVIRDDEWPAGTDATAQFARLLAERAAGYPITDISIKNQMRMQQGRQPEPHPCEVLVATGLAAQESGFVFPTPALRAALALFGGGA